MPDLPYITVIVIVSDANGRTKFTCTADPSASPARQTELIDGLFRAVGNYLTAEPTPVPPINYVG